MKLKVKLKNPINLLLIYLTILIILALVSRTKDILFLFDSLIKYCLLFICMYYPQYFLSKLSFVKKYNFKNLIISYLIIILIVDPSNSYFTFLVIGFLYVLIKNFITHKSNPILNPSAISTLSSIAIIWILASQIPLISWWGVNSGPKFTNYNISLAFFLTISFGSFISYRLKKFYYIIAFVIGYILVFTLLNFQSISANQILYFLFEGKLIFYVFVMLIEPNTSPIKTKEQIIFGIIGSITLTLLIKSGNAIEPYLLTLIILNLLFFLKKYLVKD